MTMTGWAVILPPEISTATGRELAARRAATTWTAKLAGSVNVLYWLSRGRLTAEGDELIDRTPLILERGLPSDFFGRSVAMGDLEGDSATK